MARYIDMDKLGKMIEARAEQLIEGKDALLYVAKWLNLLPEADVAPRAEVARDIVEFLFRRSESLQHLFKDNPDSAQCFRGRFELENAAITIANKYGVDLTKEEAEAELSKRSRGE